MGTYANFFIEVKEKKTGKWELLNIFSKFVQHSYETYDSESKKIVTKYSSPDMCSTGNKFFSKENKLTYQGYIRDIFSSRGNWNDFGLSDKGLPEDISDEVKDWFKKESEKIDPEKYMYKWWWGETYATIGELNTVRNKVVDNWEKSVIEQCKKEYKDDVVIEKLNKIQATLEGKTYKKKTSKEECYEDTLEYLFEDEMWDMLAINNFVSRITDLVEMCYSYSDYDDIRVICYLD